MRPRSLPSVLVLLAACSPGAPDTDGDQDTVDEPCALPAYDGIEGVSCDGDVARLQGTYLQDLELDPQLAWVLVGGVFFGDPTTPVTLTIPAGTTIFGDSATDGFLVIDRGSRILADGTATDPIVFTSDKDPGSRARSDWGGLVINGQAPTNVCERPEDCPVPGEAGTGVYGGADADDDSGVLRFVRIEFAGTLINDRQEINGLALQGVGRGTVVDQVHIHMAADDGIEMFGGTVDLRHIVSTGAGDDGFDWTDGWTGRAQHVVVQHHDDLGDNGIEADNNKDDFELLPWSEPTLRNVTLVKVRTPGRFTDGYGMLLRAGTAGHLHQLVVVNYPYGCANIDDPSTFTHGIDCDTSASNGSLEVSHAWFSCTDTVIPDQPFPTSDADFNDDQEVCDIDVFFRTGNDGNTVSGEHHLRAPFDMVAPDWRPVDGAPLLGVTVPADADPWFEATDHLGAMGSENWASWTTFAAD
ncbi:MAG: hypothetical protein H6732_02800 [Alphaproteobacteria bacterium]|nr:hypothetical protein [Alphaproteobacteria bacterium]